MLPDTLGPLEEIARRLDEYSKRLSHLERLESGLGWSLIESVTLTIATAGIDFQNVPTGFRHLMVLGSLRDDAVATTTNVRMRFNGDSGANYNWLFGTFRHNAVYTTTVLRNATNMIAGKSNAANAKADEFSPFQSFIPDYLNVNKYQQIDSMSWTFAADANTSMTFYRAIGSWEDMSAINRVFVFPSGGVNFIIDSTLSLYGIR